MTCPILFIRKPEESQCLKANCAFWVCKEVFEELTEDRRKFSALLTMSAEAKAEERGIEGKCAVLTLAEVMIKNKE